MYIKTDKLFYIIFFSKVSDNVPNAYEVVHENADRSHIVTYSVKADGILIFGRI